MQNFLFEKKEEALLRFQVNRPGPGRLLRAIIDQLRIIEIINTRVRWDEKQWKISPGELVASMIMCMFCRRKALYKVWEFYENQDLELLFGRKDLRAEDFNDDCLGRTLDRLAEAPFTELFGAVVFFAQQVEGFDNDVLHLDTTSLSVYGDYEYYEAVDHPFLAFGFSKDHRPDLKQFKFGLGVNSTGIPVLGQPIAGNVDDKTWNKELLQKFAKDYKAFLNSILVVDSQFVTTENLKLAEKFKFISRLPETFNLTGELKERAWQENNWQEAGSFSPAKNAATYRVQEFRSKLDDREYRFVVVNSSSLDKRKEKSIHKKITQEREKIHKALAKLARMPFVCRPDAELAWQNFLKEQKPCFHQLQPEITEQENRRKRERKGRPRKDEQPLFQKTFQIEAQVTEDREAVNKAYDIARTFILISNVDGQRADCQKLLQHYKDQHKVERGFTFLKNPYFVGPVFLKKQERIRALSYVFLLTLLVYSIFERRVRLGLHQEGEPFHVADSYRTFTPTGKTVLEPLDELHVATFDEPEGAVRKVPDNVSEKVLRILRLCGFTIEIYVSPPRPVLRE